MPRKFSQLARFNIFFHIFFSKSGCCKSVLCLLPYHPFPSFPTAPNVYEMHRPARREGGPAGPLNQDSVHGMVRRAHPGLIGTAGRSTRGVWGGG